MDQIGSLLTGSKGSGLILFLLLILIGGLFGLFGGVMGSGVRILFKKS
jgi:hypothetical protein